MGCHICQCIGIDYVVAITGTQQFDKINAALTFCTFEIGKQIVSDKGADAIFPNMTGSGIVYLDEIGYFKAGCKNFVLFTVITIFTFCDNMTEMPG